MALMQSPEGKRPHRRTKSGIEDSRKIDIKETVWEGVN